MTGFIKSFAYISSEQFITNKLCQIHPGTSLCDISRESVYAHPYRPFGKMGDTEKLLFSATSLALSGISIDESSGIVLCVPKGSIDTDIAYYKSVTEGFPSPSLFAATLPSAAIAEIAIPYLFRGPNRIIAGENQSAALLNGLFILNRNTPSVLVGYVNPDPTEGFAAVILLDSQPSKWALKFSAETIIVHQSSSLFLTLIDRMIGRNNFSAVTATNGTFYINELTDE